MVKQLTASSLGTKPDTYLYTLAHAHGNIYATIGSEDSLRLFDAASLTLLHSAQPCHEGVSCLTVLAAAQTLATAGRDGFIRFWDCRAQKSARDIVEPTGRGFSALASHGPYIAAGTESTKEGLGEVSVLLYDTRKPDEPLRLYTDSHTDTITQLAFHPTQPEVLLSASTDGLVSLFDIGHEDEDDALQQVLNPKSAVHRAGFLAHDQVYVLTSDEHFSVYGLDKAGVADVTALPVLDYGDVREKLECMYVIDILQNPSLPAPVLAYGHNEKKTLSIAPLESPSWGLGRPVSLPGGHGEEVVRDMVFVDEQTALSCGEDGHVRAWNLAPTEASLESIDVDEGGKHAKKRSRKEKKAAERFAPY